MSKLIFSSDEVHNESKEFILDFPDEYKKFQDIDAFIDFELDQESGDVVGLYKGPTIEEITEEIEKFKKEKGIQANLKIEEAEKRSLIIIKQAEEQAQHILEVVEAKRSVLLEEAEKKSNYKIEEADLYLERKKQEASFEINKIHKKASDEGYQEGLKKGFDLSTADVSVLLSRLEDIIKEALFLRERVLKDSEQQLVSIIMMIAHKVIKEESTHRKDVVIKQIESILSKIGSTTEIMIRVNMADLDIVNSSKNEFVSLISTLKDIKVLEDSTVDRGGVVIDTKYGTIDARISTQFRKIEQALQEVNISI